MIAAAPPAAIAAPAANAAPIVGSPIAHVIVVIQENRTTDNLFASSVLSGGRGYPGANVTQVANIDGKTMTTKPVPFEYPADPHHTHAALVTEWNGGKMDGFGRGAILSRSRVSAGAGELSAGVRAGIRNDDLPSARAALRARRREFRAAPRTDVSRPHVSGDGPEPSRRRPERSADVGLRFEAGHGRSDLRSGRNRNQARRFSVLRQSDDRRSARSRGRVVEILHRRLRYGRRLVGERLRRDPPYPLRPRLAERRDADVRRAERHPTLQSSASRVRDADLDGVGPCGLAQ